VRAHDGLWLTHVVARSPKGDVYVNWPRDHVSNWKPHSSYHASGWHHEKSFGSELTKKKRQKPDANFRGTAMVISTPISEEGARRVNLVCKPTDYADVMEVPASALEPNGGTAIAVSLAEPGDPMSAASLGLLMSTTPIIEQAIFKDAVPWLVVTLYDANVI
jgi:hypothetical protein